MQVLCKFTATLFVPYMKVSCKLRSTLWAISSSSHHMFEVEVAGRAYFWFSAMLSVKAEEDSDCGVIFIDDINTSPALSERKEQPHAKFIDVAGIKRRKR